MKQKLFLTALSVLIMVTLTCSYAQEPAPPYEIPIVIVKYFPVNNGIIDIKVTGDWGKSLKDTQKRVDTIIAGAIKALEEGSRFRAYTNPSAQPSIKYRVVETYEFIEPLPTYDKPDHQTPMTDYAVIVNRIDGRKWVEKKGVKEIWLFGYHGGVVDLWESNMAGPYGDVSNSDRDEKDLPVYAKTYTLYHYNYQRHISEAVEDHIHQCEAIFYSIDPELFWNRYVGYFPGGKWGKAEETIRKDRRCGWAHFPPNAEKDYDWKNKTYVLTDIEDWNPDSLGAQIRINSDRWNSRSLDWFVYWMQSIPGMNNGLTFQGKPLTNWWMFIGAYDDAKKNNLKFTK